VADEQDPTRLPLEVYDTKSGLWHPEFGELAQPDGWELLPAGDAFMTRHVKSAGVYWTLFRPKGRRQHRRQLGVLAPTEAITAARSAADASAGRRAVRRESSTRQRDRGEAAYRDEFRAAVIEWLEFAPANSELALEIADGAVERAAVVGSGRVGRTKTLSLEERATLAARAYLRHRYTDYEDRLLTAEDAGLDFDQDPDLVDIGDYREIKQTAQRQVDAFLERHRTTD
jgi:hypothetical protein